ncbi:MAG: SOS response-associated peptidase [Phenylobacterium sp.]|nr:SOS response-associated peptidase [Phenylobacterium sp.]
MCNLYSMTKSRAALVAIARAMHDRNNNQPPMPGIFPDYAAPVIVNGPEGREVRDMRWGLPSSKKALFDAASKRADKLRAKGQDIDFDALLKMEPDRGTTNVRNTTSRHWQPWLGPANRCLVPFTSFSEPDQVGGSLKPVWFARSEDRPIAFFAGIWTAWGCVRKISVGWEDIELYGFLTTDANAEVATYHSKAMPVILTEPEAADLWLSDAPWDAVKHLQRPLPDGTLQVVAMGDRKDEGVAA